MAEIKQKITLKLLAFLIGGTSFVLSFLTLPSRALAVDWSKKLGAGVFTEMAVGAVVYSEEPIPFPSLSHGISINYGIAEGIRIGADLGAVSLTASQGSGDEKSSTSLFSWSVGAHGAIDLLSKEGGSLYGILKLGYGGASGKTEKHSETEKGKTEPHELPSLSAFSIGAGIGVEALVAQSVGLAVEGLLFSLQSGSIKSKKETRTPTGEVKPEEEKTDISSTGFIIFPSVRLVARYYF
jgi:hypothetical protein